MSSVGRFFSTLFVLCWDTYLSFVNLVTPNLKVGRVISEGQPGAGGKWPEYIAPKDDDSRCACPALNALANHGILPRDGRNISFKELNRTVNTTYHFAASFCYFVPDFAARMLGKKYSKDSFDLHELSLHNGIEHDGSLTREDVFHQQDQGKPHVPLIRELLASATGTGKDGKKQLTVADLSRQMSKRRYEAPKKNPEYSTSTFHKIFGSSNSATLLAIFGGDIKTLESILLDEKIPETWEPYIRARKGLTMMKFNTTALRIEMGINEKQFKEAENETPA